MIMKTIIPLLPFFSYTISIMLECALPSSMFCFSICLYTICGWMVPRAPQHKLPTACGGGGGAKLNEFNER
uniref:Uncharacterized protein n=1 Tax=Anopheles darlingi TaxID=43151 RepID=A0A2M4DDK5_ANODA